MIDYTQEPEYNKSDKPDEPDDKQEPIKKRQNFIVRHKYGITVLIFIIILLTSIITSIIHCRKIVKKIKLDERLRKGEKVGKDFIDIFK
jgi:hypothetical protein